MYVLVHMYNFKNCNFIGNTQNLKQLILHDIVCFEIVYSSSLQYFLEYVFIKFQRGFLINW